MTLVYLNFFAQIFIVFNEIFCFLLTTISGWVCQTNDIIDLVWMDSIKFDSAGNLGSILCSAIRVLFILHNNFFLIVSNILLICCNLKILFVVLLRSCIKTTHELKFIQT